MLKMILDIDGSHLPEGINVCSTAGLNLAMLTLNLLDCMYNDTTMGDLHPLSELIRHPEAAATHLLPTMFDSQHEIVFGMMKAMKDKEGGNPRAFGRLDIPEKWCSIMILMILATSSSRDFASWNVQNLILKIRLPL